MRDRRGIERLMRWAASLVRRQYTYALGTLMFLVVSGIVLTIHDQYEQAVSDSEALKLTAISDQLATRVALGIERRFDLLAYVASFAAEEDERRIERELSRVYQLLPEAIGLNLIDRERIIRIVTPRERNQSAIGRTVGQSPAVVAVLEEAERTGTPRATPVMQLFQGGEGFVTYFPIYRDGNFVGFVNCVFDPQRLLATVLGATDPGIAITVSDAGRPVSRIGGVDGPAVTATRQIPVLNRTWTITVDADGRFALAAAPVRSIVLAGLASALLGSILLAVVLRQRAVVRERAEAQRRAELRLASVARNVPGVIYQTRRSADGSDFRYTFVSERVADYFGCTPAEACRDPILPHAAVHPDDREAFDAGLSDSNPSFDRPVDSEYRIMRSGTTLWLRSTRWFRREPDGSIVADGLAIDITQQKEAEFATAQAYRQVDAIMNNTVDGLITIDEHGAILSFSKPAQRIFGYEADEVVGRNVSVLMPEPYHSAHDGYIISYLNTGHGKVVGIGREVRGRRKDGSEFPMDLAVGEIPVASGLRQFVGTVRDITQKIQVEMQLRQALKMEAVGQLTGGIAHDFNNLLAVIIGNLQLALDDIPPDHPACELSKDAIHAALRGADLTRQLLSFARRTPLKPEPVTVEPLIENCARLYRSVLGEAVSLAIEHNAGDAMVEVDAASLESALLNLAVNARDAMLNGGRLLIQTALEPTPELDRAVRISMVDTGKGMTPDVVAKAFDPFFTTKGPGEGSGLGLSMVYGFVKQSGGQIAIDSTPGSGTRIDIWLPQLVRATTVSEESPTEPAQAVEPAQVVLLVEDDFTVREMTTRMLRREGLAVLSAADAREATTILDANPDVDVLLTDVILPGAIDGFRLAQQTRERWPDIGVVCMSGYTGTHARADEIRTAGFEWLAKPFARADLCAALSRAVRTPRR